MDPSTTTNGRRTLNDQFKSTTHRPTNHRERAKAMKTRSEGGFKELWFRLFKEMGYIEVAFVLYSATHNIANAYVRANGNMAYFTLVFLGVLSVEWMLVKSRRGWMSGQYLGRSLGWAKVSFYTCIVLASTGIISQAASMAGANPAWISFVYTFVFPGSIGLVYFLDAKISVTDPVKKAARKVQHARVMAETENKLEEANTAMMEVQERKSLRLLNHSIFNQRVFYLLRAANSWQARRTVKESTKQEIPAILAKQKISVDVAKATYLPSRFFTVEGKGKNKPSKNTSFR